MNTLYNSVVNANHTLIAGTSGSGKSVLINGALCHCLEHFPNGFQYILIDLKRVELQDYRETKQCYYYADTESEAVTALQMAVNLIELRFADMQAKHLRKSTDPVMYVVIDELADLMLTVKTAAKLIQRIGQLGRACNVKLICATQCPIAKVIPTAIKVNFDCIIGLRTRTAQDSRNIIGINGCESLPKHGLCYLDTPDLSYPGKFPVPNCTEEQIQHFTSINSMNHRFTFTRVI